MSSRDEDGRRACFWYNDVLTIEYASQAETGSLPLHWCDRRYMVASTRATESRPNRWKGGVFFVRLILE
jgi:hypothetical protein